MSNMPATGRPVRHWIVKFHRWLGLGVAAFWLLQALTGMLLSFHFELEDAAQSTKHRPTDRDAIEQRMDGLAAAGGDAKVHWIWTTAGLADRYVIFFDGPDGVGRKVYIDGAGEVLNDRRADEYSFLGTARQIHLTLLAGQTGHWILAVSGVVLFINLIFGVVASWPRRGQRWRDVLKPVGTAKNAAGLYSWHRAVGLWAAIPALVIVGTGTLMLFEHEIRDLLGADEVALPANPPVGLGVGFAVAAEAAVAAIPGSRFVGTTLPTAGDASYQAWVRGPGELYRGGYGGSLVVIDANDGSVRAAFPLTEAGPAQAFVGSFYPLHTGEALGTFGRLLTMAVGLWLAVTVVLGVWLWLRRRSKGGVTRRS